MSQTAKSSTKSRRLVVVNPGSDSDDSGEEEPRLYTSYPNPISQSHYHLLPSTTAHSPYTGKSVTIAPAATPLTTNLLYDCGPFYQGSWSNPALSSPSSSSSHAMESTPPPVTPSLSSPPVDIIEESSPSLEPTFMASSSDRTEPLQQPSRPNNPTSYSRPTNQLQARPLPNSSPRLEPVCLTFLACYHLTYTSLG